MWDPKMYMRDAHMQITYKYQSQQSQLDYKYFILYFNINILSIIIIISVHIIELQPCLCMLKLINHPLFTESSDIALFIRLTKHETQNTNRILS